MGASENDMMKAFGELDKHIMKVMDESVELEEKVNTKAIQKAVDAGKSMDVIMTMFANKRTTNTDEIRKVVKDYMWKKRMKKEEVELEENMSRVAKELETYARKNGGIDKMDFMKAAMMMKKGQTKQLKKFVDDLDTEPREKILSLMDKDADRRKEFKAAQKAMRKEDLEIDLEEGVNDPGIFKAVFLAGGPGSGKSFMVGKTALTTLGLKLINSDPAFETQLKKVGLKATPEDIFTPKGQDARAKAKRLTAKQQELALNGRLGLVIDGTGKDYAQD